MNLTNKPTKIESVSLIEKTITILVNKLGLCAEIENIAKLKNLSPEELNDFEVIEDYIFWPKSKKKLFVSEIINLALNHKDDFKYYLQNIPINKINLIQHKFLDENSLLYETYPNVNPDNIQLLLKTRPIVVRRKKGNYECLSNFRLFHFAKENIDSKTQIPALVVNSINQNKIDLLIWNEVFLFPAIHRQNKKVMKYFYDVWKEHEHHKNPWISNSLQIDKNNQSAFAQTFNVDRRKLK